MMACGGPWLRSGEDPPAGTHSFCLEAATDNAFDIPSAKTSCLTREFLVS